MPSLGTITDPPNEEVFRREQNVESKLETAAVENLASVGDPDDVHVRDLLPSEDLVSGADNGWSGDTRKFTQVGLSVDTLNEVYEIDSNGRAENKIISIYAVANVQDDPITTEVEFQTGTNAPFERAQVQDTESVEVSDVVLLEKDVEFGADQDGTIHQWSDTDASDDTMIYFGKVAEQVGRTLEERRNARSRSR